MNTAWLVMTDHLQDGKVIRSSFVGLLSGTFSAQAICALLPEIYKAQVMQHKEMSAAFSNHADPPGFLSVYTDKPDTCEAHVDVLEDGTLNDRKVICNGWSKEQLVAVFAENVSLDIDSDYKERLRWAHQDFLGLKDGILHMDRYYDYSLVTDGGVIERSRD